MTKNITGKVIKMKIPIETLKQAEKELQSMGNFGILTIVLSMHDGHLKSRIVKEISIVPGRSSSGKTGNFQAPDS
jgi:tetrahydromethanopterin S-methyltransferase subunit C